MYIYVCVCRHMYIYVRVYMIEFYAVLYTWLLTWIKNLGMPRKRIQNVIYPLKATDMYLPSSLSQNVAKVLDHKHTVCCFIKTNREEVAERSLDSLRSAMKISTMDRSVQGTWSIALKSGCILSSTLSESIKTRLGTKNMPLLGLKTQMACKTMQIYRCHHRAVCVENCRDLS